MKLAINYILKLAIEQGCPTVFEVGPNFISSRSRWAAKSCLCRILLQFLNSGILYKKKGLHLFSCSDFLSFVVKFRCSLKKSSKISSYLSISAPNVFQQSRGTLLRNLHYSQKTGNRRWAAPEPQVGRRLDTPDLEYFLR